MYKQERTCVCVKDMTYTVDIGGLSSQEPLDFHKRREYQVDVYPLYYQVYQNGGWDDFIFLTEEQFHEYFQLIE